MPEGEPEQWVEVQIARAALKTHYREFGIERDRNSVLQIATFLMRLSKEGIRDAEESCAECSTATVCRFCS